MTKQEKKKELIEKTFKAEGNTRSYNEIRADLELDL